MLHECLIPNDFIQNPVDNCVYMKQNKRLLIVSLADDLIIADIMTKPVTKLKLERFKRLLFGL